MNAAATMRQGPWWVTSFSWQDRECVIRFKIGADGNGGWRPTRCEFVSGCAYPEPTRAVKYTAARRFIRKHRAIIEDAQALADGRPPRGPYAAAAEPAP